MSIVYVVGLGPGAGEQMTAQARQALEQCPVIAGYTVYIDLIRGEFPEKQFLMTPMRKEAERCKMALEPVSYTHLTGGRWEKSRRDHRVVSRAFIRAVITGSGITESESPNRSARRIEII